jgi:hypothetical protein
VFKICNRLHKFFSSAHAQWTQPVDGQCSVLDGRAGCKFRARCATSARIERSIQKKMRDHQNAPQSSNVAILRINDPCQSPLKRETDVTDSASGMRAWPPSNLCAESPRASAYSVGVSLFYSRPHACTKTRPVRFPFNAASLPPLAGVLCYGCPRGRRRAITNQVPSDSRSYVSHRPHGRRSGSDCLRSGAPCGARRTDGRLATKFQWHARQGNLQIQKPGATGSLRCRYVGHSRRLADSAIAERGLGVALRRYTRNALLELFRPN